MLCTGLITVAALVTATTSTLLSRGVLEPPPAGEHLSFLSSELLATADTLRASEAASPHELLVFQDRISASKRRIDTLQLVVQHDSEDFTRARIACQVAKLVFSKVTVSNDSDYEVEKNANWSQTCWLPAACFVRPQNSLEVAAVLKIITHLQVKFAIRSGGHNANAGFSSTDANGLLIDVRDLHLRAMNADGTMTAGSGNRWQDVYDFLDGYGLGAVGGRHDGVGVAGFLVGGKNAQSFIGFPIVGPSLSGALIYTGGMSFFPNLYGLGADNVQNIKVVLANSTIVDANVGSNADLFRALKGGASNFGIVTEFRIRTQPIQRLWYSLDIYDPADWRAVLDATVKAQHSMESDRNLGLFVNVGPQALFVGKLYAQYTSYPSAFEGFSRLRPIQVFIPPTNGTLKNLVTAINTHTVEAKREPQAVSHGVDLDLYIRNHEQYLALVNSSRSSTATLTYTIQPVGKACIESGRQRGGNSLGLELVPQTWLAPLVEWTSQEDDKAAHELVTQMSDRVRANSKEQNASFSYQFMNDASQVQKPLASYGLTSFSNMVAVSRVYDPDQVFQKLQNSGFLLSRM